MIQHKHSLIMIKKTINQKETQFLLYYDEKWDCKLFLNYKTTERNNEQNIVSRIAEGFNVHLTGYRKQLVMMILLLMIDIIIG